MEKVSCIGRVPVRVGDRKAGKTIGKKYAALTVTISLENALHKDTCSTSPDAGLDKITRYIFLYHRFTKMS